MTEFDFLDASGREFHSESDLFAYVDEEEALDDVGSNVNIIGSVNNYQTRAQFFSALEENFERIWEEDDQDLELLSATTGGRAVPYYVYYDDDFPVFLTTANISDEMPDTIEQFLINKPNIGRFWISMQEMDQMRSRLVRQDDDVTIPFFTGHRSKYSDVPAEKREDVTRTMTYWAVDGRKTYKEMRKKYGILPTNIRFERPSHYKFGLKQEGILTHQSGSISRAWELLEQEKERKKRLKDVINSGGSRSVESGIFEQEVSASRPWEVNVDPLQEEALDSFRARLSEERWKLGLSEYYHSGKSKFNAEIIDEYNFGRTEMEGRNDSIRVYPIDGNDIDPQFRIFNFVQDHFDSDCEPAVV